MNSYVSKKEMFDHVVSSIDKVFYLSYCLTFKKTFLMLHMFHKMTKDKKNKKKKHKNIKSNCDYVCHMARKVAKH